MKTYKVEWSEYNKLNTVYKEERDTELVDADDPEDAIELIKQYIFDNTDHEEYPEMEITEDGVDLGEVSYINFTASIYMTAISGLIKKTGMTQKAFSEYFNIPIRTIEDWNTGKRNPPEYVVDLIEYKLIKEGFICQSKSQKPKIN